MSCLELFAVPYMPYVAARIRREKIRRKGRKLKRRIESSRAPLTILWGRDGWEKFVAMVIFGVALLFELIGLFAKVRRGLGATSTRPTPRLCRAGLAETLLFDCFPI